MGTQATNVTTSEINNLEISAGNLNEILSKAGSMLLQQRRDRENGRVNDRTNLDAGAILILAIMFHYHERGIEAVEESTLKWWHDVAMSVVEILAVSRER